MVDNVVVLAGIFFVAGLYVAVQEALESTVTAEMVQAETMTMSIGVLGTVNGMAKFVSSAAVGVVWTAVSPEVFHPGGWVYVDRYITDLAGARLMSRMTIERKQIWIYLAAMIGNFVLMPLVVWVMLQWLPDHLFKEKSANLLLEPENSA